MAKVEQEPTNQRISVLEQDQFEAFIRQHSGVIHFGKPCQVVRGIYQDSKTKLLFEKDMPAFVPSANFLANNPIHMIRASINGNPIEGARLVGCIIRNGKDGGPIEEMYHYIDLRLEEKS